MNFNSLQIGSTFYLLTKTKDKPVLTVGTVKNISTPRTNYQSGQTLIDITANIDGNDRLFKDVPVNTNIATEDNCIFAVDNASIQLAIENEIKIAHKVIELYGYYETMANDGKSLIEQVNPKYAEERRQERRIVAVEHRLTETDKKLDLALEMLKKLVPSDDNAKEPTLNLK